MPEVRIYHDDGSTESIPVTSAFRVAEQIGGMTEYRITVERSLAQAVSLTRKRDEIELVGFGRGPLVDLETGAETHTLVARSPEWYSTTVTPSDGGTLAEGDDATLIADQIARVPEWTAGSIGSFTGALTFVFNHAFPAEALRRIERNVPGELRFGDDGTVDYVDALGSDRAGSVTLSPAAGTIEERIQITERGRTLDATHVRVLGAHEGEAQYFANLVPASDPATYANRVDYTTSRWSDGDPRDWDRWQNKDVMAQDTIEEEAATLGAELTETYVEAETVVSGVSPRLSLGDFVRVQKPDAGLDRDMRVHRVVTRSAEGTPAGVVQEVTLSTRTVARDDVSADARDIQRFNTAFQGSSVVIQGGGGRQPVESGVPAEEPFRYPDVDFEHIAEVEVEGLPYRSYVSGAGHAHDVEIGTTTSLDDSLDLEESAQLTLQVVDNATLNNGATASGTVTIPSSWEGFPVLVVLNLTGAATGSSAPAVGDDVVVSYDTSSIITPGIRVAEHHEFAPSLTFFGENNSVQTYRVLTDVQPGNNFSFAVQNISGQDIFFNTAEVTLVNMRHQHDVEIGTTTSESAAGFEPGVVEDFSGHPQANASGELLPSNVDLLVNGTTVASNIGSGRFETTVDISGALTDGAFNTIEATSDSIGHLKLTPFIQSYKQIGSQ
jgi:hypothetical protein